MLFGGGGCCGLAALDFVELRRLVRVSVVEGGRCGVDHGNV